MTTIVIGKSSLPDAKYNVYFLEKRNDIIWTSDEDFVILVNHLVDKIKSNVEKNIKTLGIYTNEQ